MLTRIDLRFFKCFELLRLPLAPLTLLTGLNASGKSSVLQALALLNQTMREHEWSTRLELNGEVVSLGSALDVIDEENSKNSFAIAIESDDMNCEWEFFGNRQDLSMTVTQVTIGKAEFAAPLSLQYLFPGPSELFPRLGELSVDNENLKTIIKIMQSLLGMSYITAERIPPQDTYSLISSGQGSASKREAERIPPQDTYSPEAHISDVVGPRGEYAISMLHWREDEPVPDELVHQESPSLLMRQVEERMRSLFPGFRINLQRAGNSLILGLRISDSSGFHNPINTGFGLTQVLPIVVAILAANKGDIIMIENPEIHLHPAGQALIGQFMADAARAGIQLLVETHSDHVLNGVRRAVKDSRLSADQVAIHFFRPRSEGQTQVMSPNIDDSGNIDSWPDDFFDQFDKDANYFAGWGDR